MMTLHPKFPGYVSGFSLIEMAMVLMIIGTLMGGVLVAVSQTTENSRRVTARNQLREVETALYGFAQIHGRLPCPALHNSNGNEGPINAAGCISPHGFVPSVTLNLNGAINADGLLLDPWQNPLRYSVATATVPVFTDKISIRDFFDDDSTLATTNMLRVCSSSPCTAANELATMLPALVLSMGTDWSSYSSVDEQENTDTDNDFVSADYAEDLFDDQLVWISPYILFNKMISAGKLP